jgi:hypothetical protein
MCTVHYRRHRTGQPLSAPVRRYVRGPVADRLLAWSTPTDTGCRLWTGHTYSNGYGRMNVGGRARLVHRLSYTEFVGPIPDGLEIDHRCRNKLCIEPAHLEPVTRAMNLLRSNVYMDHGPDGRFLPHYEKRYKSPVVVSR